MVEFDLFEELGLSKNEGKVYDALVRHGKLSASEASSKSEVPYGRIYDVLSALVHKGLAEIIPEKTKKFAPSSPDSLLKLINNKEKKLEEAKEKVKEMKQFYEVKEKSPVIVGHGEKAFWKISDEMGTAKKYVYNIKWTSEFRPNSAASAKKSLKNKIDTKVLTRYDEETKKNVKKFLKYYKNIRKIENEGFAGSIMDDEMVLLSFVKNNTVLLIKDEAFAKIMKKMFLETFKNSEKIK